MRCFHGRTTHLSLSFTSPLLLLSYAWILEPHSLPSSYISFLNKQGGKDKRIIQAVKEVASLRRPLPSAALIESAYAEEGVRMAVDSHITIPCQVCPPMDTHDLRDQLKEGERREERGESREQREGEKERRERKEERGKKKEERRKRKEERGKKKEERGKKREERREE